jgi:hypothetical protein
MQAVFVKTQLPPEVWDRFKELSLETSVHLTGEVRAEPRAPGGFEMGVVGLAVIGPSPLDYPIQPKEHGIDFLLDHRHFWLRSPRQRAIFVIRTRSNKRSAIFLRARISSSRHADSHGGDRRAKRSVCHGVLRRRERVSRANGAARRRAAAAAFRKDLYVRTNVPRRKVEDAPAPHRILDDRA